MKKYLVNIERTYTKSFTVKANNKKEAESKIYKSKQGDYRQIRDCLGVNVSSIEEIKDGS